MYNVKYSVISTAWGGHDSDELLTGLLLAGPSGACKVPSTGVIPKPFRNPSLLSPLVPSVSDPAADALMLEDRVWRESLGEPARDIGGENKPESS